MRTDGPNPGLGLAILRVVLGVVFVAHGAHKLFASGAMEQTGMFFDSIGIPLAGTAAWVVTLLEVGGGLALVVGFLVAPVALLLSLHMLLGIILVHAENGFWVLGPGQGGVEFNLVLIAGLLALVLAGPGAAAMDARTGGAELGAGGTGGGAGSGPGGAGATGAGGGEAGYDAGTQSSDVPEPGR